MAKQYYIYILRSDTNVLYIGVTDNLIRRIYEHKLGIVKGFTKKYKVKQLVYYEMTPDIQAAILREKQLKKWKRNWKNDLIKKSNPKLVDLYPTILSSSTGPL